MFAQESLSESRVLQDNRPLPPVDLSRGGPPTTGYVGLASYNLLGNDIGVCPLYFNVHPTIISIGIIEPEPRLRIGLAQDYLTDTDSLNS